MGHWGSVQRVIIWCSIGVMYNISAFVKIIFLVWFSYFLCRRRLKIFFLIFAPREGSQWLATQVLYLIYRKLLIQISNALFNEILHHNQFLQYYTGRTKIKFIYKRYIFDLFSHYNQNSEIEKFGFIIDKFCLYTTEFWFYKIFTIFTEKCVGKFIFAEFSIIRL